MNLAVLKVLHSLRQVAVVGVLVRQETHVLADGLRSLIPQRYGTTVVALVVIECVLDCQILQIGAAYVLRDTQCSRLVNRLGLGVRSVSYDGLLHRLTDDSDVILADGRQYGLAEVIRAVWQEDLVAALCLRHSQQEGCRVTTRN